MRRLSAICARGVLALACLLWLALPALAQSSTGEIDILVVDSGTQQPLGNARLILLGAQTANSLTTASGSIRFTDAPIGIYRVRVQHAGYDAGVSREFDVLPDRAVNVRVELVKRVPRPLANASPSPGASPNPQGSPGGLKIIATVVARTRISITTTDIGADSPMRRLSDSLTDALDKLAGVSVTTDSTDPTSAVTISLHNQDESQTAMTLDGIPLSAPGVAGNLRGIGTDLFSGSRVSFSPSAGGLAGSVNFRTLEPTQALQVRGSGSMGTYDRSNYSLAATGSIANLGIAVQHTWRGANSPLTFETFEDQSGLTYAHEGESTTMGDFVKFRYRLGDDRTTISATALTTNRDAFSICARDVTLLPCGIGPDNRTYGRYGFAYTTIQSLVGDIQTTFSAYANTSTNTTDDVNRFVLDPTNSYMPTLDPSLATNVTTTRGVAYSGSIAKGNHTFSISASTYASTSVSTPLAGSQFETAFTNSATSSTYRFADAIKSNDQLIFTPSLSLANTSGLGTSFLSGLNLTWTPKAADAYAFSMNVGSSQPNLSANRSFSDPNAARFDCQAGTAIVGAPGDTGGGTHQSATAFTAAWSHQFHGGASFTLDAYEQVQSGQLIGALIQEPLSIYPAGFLGVLNTAFHAPTVCGASLVTPAVFAQEQVAGTRRTYQGIDLSGRFALSPTIQILPTYSLNLAVLSAASARLQDGASTSIVGAQLPGRPIHRAGVTIDGLLPRSGIELLANGQFTGSNNGQNLGPYVNVSLGVSHKFGPGQITLFENNAFNTYAGVFSSDTFAQPMPLSNGMPFLTAARPLTPRTLFLSYSAALGGPAPGPAFNSLGRGARAALAPQPSPSPARRGQPFAAFPPPEGTDPLSLATTRPSCNADAQTNGAPVFAALKAYLSAYEAGTTLPVFPNMTVVAHRLTADPTVPYYLELRSSFQRPPGADNAQGGNAPRLPRARGAGGGAGGAGGPGIPGGPGGEPGAPGGETAPGMPNAVGAAGGANPGSAAARRAAATPEARAYRGFIGCTYITLMTSTEAKAKGITFENGRGGGMIYIPKIGIIFVQPPQLPQGGGSLRQAT
jgi:hypothetical protein